MDALTFAVAVCNTILACWALINLRNYIHIHSAERHDLDTRLLLQRELLQHKMDRFNAVRADRVAAFVSQDELGQFRDKLEKTERVVADLLAQLQVSGGIAQDTAGIAQEQLNHGTAVAELQRRIRAREDQRKAEQ